MNPSDVNHSDSTSPEVEPEMELTGDSFDGMSEVERELYDLLHAERITSQRHSANYQTLKSEYLRMEEAYTRMEGELDMYKNEQQVQQEKVEQRLSELHQALLDKTKELKELQAQVVTPHQVVLIKAQLQQEMEAPNKQRFSELEEEAEKYCSKYNKLWYEFMVLQSQNECQKEEHRRAMELMEIRHEEEISSREKDLEDLVSQVEAFIVLNEKNQVEELQSENGKLQLRMKLLEDEVANVYLKVKKANGEAETAQRAMKQQQHKFEAERKSLEAEHEAVRHQLEWLKHQFELASVQNEQLTSQLHQRDRDVSALNCELKSLEHSHKQEVSNIKLESARSKEKLEREKDDLQEQFIGIQAEVKELQEAVEWHKELMTKKDREMVAKVLSVREEVISKFNTLNEEKLNLEVLLDEEAEQRAADCAEKKKLEVRLYDAEHREELAREEVQSLRNKVQQQNSQLEELRTALDQAKKRQHEAERRESDPEEQVKLRRQLKELQRKFKLQQLQLGGRGASNAGQLNSFPAVGVGSGPGKPKSNIPEDQGQTEASLLHQKMHNLRDGQQAQLEELALLFHQRGGTPVSEG